MENGFEFNEEYRNGVVDSIRNSFGIGNTKSITKKKPSLYTYIEKLIKSLPYDRIFKIESMVFDRNANTNLEETIKDVFETNSSINNSSNNLDLYRSKSTGYYIKLRNGVASRKNRDLLERNIFKTEITKKEMQQNSLVARINNSYIVNRTISIEDIDSMLCGSSPHDDSVDIVDNVAIDNSLSVCCKPSFNLGLEKNRFFLNCVIETTDPVDNTTTAEKIAEKSGITGKALGAKIGVLSKSNILTRLKYGSYQINHPKDWSYKNLKSKINTTDTIISDFVGEFIGQSNG
jgi:hypothetical protein